MSSGSPLIMGGFRNSDPRDGEACGIGVMDACFAGPCGDAELPGSRHYEGRYSYVNQGIPGRVGYDQIDALNYVGEHPGHVDKAASYGNSARCCQCFSCIISLTMIVVATIWRFQLWDPKSLTSQFVDPRTDALAGGAAKSGEEVFGGAAKSGEEVFGPLPTTTSRVVYDCRDRHDRWQLPWTSEKQRWCCNAYGVHCASPATSLGPATSATSLVFDCKSGLVDSQDWSKSKQSWCCSHHGLGCVTATITTTESSFHCDVDLGHWHTLWSRSKKVWCCQHYELGCPIVLGPQKKRRHSNPSPAPTTVASTTAVQMTIVATTTTAAIPTTTAGCDAVCIFDAHSSTCRSRLLFAAAHQFQGQRHNCDSAAKLVMAQCPSCTSCSIADSGCLTMTMSRSAELMEAATSPSTTLVKASSSTPEASEKYDCSKGFSNWMESWSVRQAIWCCTHKGRGCPSQLNLSGASG